MNWTTIPKSRYMFRTHRPWWVRFMDSNAYSAVRFACGVFAIFAIALAGIAFMQMSEPGATEADRTHLAMVGGITTLVMIVLSIIAFVDPRE